MDKGVAKKINKGAEKLVFDILQATQYSTPIPSTVRELVTNACDAQREKEIAIEILSGEKQVSDYYITRDGEQYSDSNFDPSYYSLPNLDLHRNHVEITYIHNSGVGYCDLLVVKDYGVGIGERRLEGILELGYSTKRNTSQNFGAFGLGAKVALSTGVDFYTIETVYNGKRFKANCFNYKTDFIIPKFNLTTGEINPSITLSDGSTVYYEETTDLNWTEVSFGVKSHNSSRFRDAIEEQLNYLDNVVFYEQYGDDSISKRKIDIKSEVIYNSSNLIVSTNNYLRKPHIVIVKEDGASTGINYGYVDFRELEMEDLYGAVGLKCPVKQSYIDENGDEVVIQDGVEVTPSREKVIWSDSTKAFIQKLISQAAVEVTELVEKELLETDFLKWLNVCREVVGGRPSSKNDTSDKTLSILSRIIDTKSIKPKYPANPAIKFTNIPSTLNGFSVKLHSRKIDKTVKDSSVSATFTYSSEKIDHWDQIGDRKIFYRTGNSNKYKDFYLYDLHGAFITIKKTSLNYYIDKMDEPGASDNDIAYLQREHDSKLANQSIIEPLIQASELYMSYDDIELPENIKELFDGAEKDAATIDNVHSLTPEERRKLNQQVVIYTLRNGNPNHYWEFVWDKVEPKLSTLVNSKTLTYYATDADAEKLKSAAFFVSKYNKSIGTLCKNSGWSYMPYGNKSDTCYYFDEMPSRCGSNYFTKSGDDFSDQVQLIKISESNLKYIKDKDNYKHIDEFFLTIDEDDNYTCHPIIKNFANSLWASKFNVFKNLFNADHCFELDHIDDRYSKIYKYMYRVKNNASIPANPSDIIKDIQKLVDFEYAVHIAPDELKEEVRAALSRDLFVLDIPGVKVLNYKFMEYVEFAEEFTRDSFNLLPHVYMQSQDVKDQVTTYLKAVKALDIAIPEVE